MKLSLSAKVDIGDRDTTHYSPYSKHNNSSDGFISSYGSTTCITTTTTTIMQTKKLSRSPSPSTNTIKTTTTHAYPLQVDSDAMKVTAAAYQTFLEKQSETNEHKLQQQEQIYQEEDSPGERKMSSPYPPRYKCEPVGTTSGTMPTSSDGRVVPKSMSVKNENSLEGMDSYALQFDLDRTNHSLNKPAQDTPTTTLTQSSTIGSGMSGMSTQIADNSTTKTQQQHQPTNTRTAPMISMPPSTSYYYRSDIHKVLSESSMPQHYHPEILQAKPLGRLDSGNQSSFYANESNNVSTNSLSSNDSSGFLHYYPANFARSNSVKDSGSSTDRDRGNGPVHTPPSQLSLLAPKVYGGGGQGGTIITTTTKNIASSTAKKQWQQQQQQPKAKVYSAIGSLENINTNNLGSFNQKLIYYADKVSTAPTIEDLKATSTQISKRENDFTNNSNPYATNTSQQPKSTVSKLHASIEGLTSQARTSFHNLLQIDAEPSSQQPYPAGDSTQDGTMRKSTSVESSVLPSTLSNRHASETSLSSGYYFNPNEPIPRSASKLREANNAAVTTNTINNTVSISSTTGGTARLDSKIQPSEGRDILKSTHKKSQKKKHVTINTNILANDKNKSMKQETYDHIKIRNKKRLEQPVELFRPSCDAYTPRMGRKQIKYKPATQRGNIDTSNMGTIQRPNFRDALRRVAMILRKHIIKIEERFEVSQRCRAEGRTHTGSDLFRPAMRDAFAEDSFVSPRYKCTIVHLPMARPGVTYGMRKIRVKYSIPTENDIFEFAHQLFKSVQLSSECSIICLIYVERLMEVAKVPLLANTWRPIFMCGLLLASKVWQDWSSWNIEFASVYPQFSLDAINRLELQFLKMVKWDLYISTSLYAKYYFALRSLLEKQDFRQRYIRMVGGADIAASEAQKVSKRSEELKKEALSQLSRSM